MSLKPCSSCLIVKPVEDFGLNKTKYDGRQSQCKSCRNEYGKNWYSKNHDLHLSRVNSSRKKYRKWFYDLLKTKQCVDCGESRPETFHFDHLDPQQKEHNVSNMISNGYNKDSVLLEIAKCEVRCANCHAVKTAKQFGWYNFNAE